MWKIFPVSKVDDKKENKKGKSVRDLMEASRTGPEQESSTRNGKLGVCELEISKRFAVKI